jgi:hypothetical protein
MLSASSASNSAHDDDADDEQGDGFGQHRSAPQSQISEHVGTAHRALVHASATELDVPCADSACRRANQTLVFLGVVDVYRLAMLRIRDGGAGGDGRSASATSNRTCVERRAADGAFLF